MNMTSYLRKVLQWITLGLLSAFLLAGCGGNASTVEFGSSADAGAPDESGAPVVPGGPVGPGGNPDIEVALRYIKASNTGRGDSFGFSTALSADGKTLAVGAHREASNARGVNKLQNNEGASGAGAVYVFARSGNTWVQQAYVKASNSERDDSFGYKLALSGDGNTLAVGASGEDSGEAHNQESLSASDSGAVYVFFRTNNDWSQQAYLKAETIGVRDGFGASLALSGNGNTLAVGATGEDSHGPPASDALTDAGAAYVFLRTGTTWEQQAYVKATVPGLGEQFGFSVTVSDDGNVMAVGATERNNYTGAAYVFQRTNGHWNQEALLQASNFQSDDRFGYSVALSRDGQTLAVGAIGESSGDPKDPSNEDLNYAGAVYVFTHSAGTWPQRAYVKASNPGNNDEFGASVALSPDGKVMVAGARHEASDAIDIGGAQDDNNLFYAGAVYVFTRGSDDAWTQRAYVKASNTGADDVFGASVALSMSANRITLAVGAPGEASAAVGIDGDQANDSSGSAGAVYVRSISLN